MNKLILCEGKTDAVLLSYYLGHVEGWKNSKEAPNDLRGIKRTAKNQSVNWYQKNGDYLLICAVGGKDNFQNFCRKTLGRSLLDNAFEKIVIVTDRDDREIYEIEESTSDILENVSATVENNKWISFSSKDRFGQDKLLNVLLVIIPAEHKGALETVMLKAIEERNYIDRNIVTKTGDFAKQMRREASIYISNDSDELKAHLGLTWAIQSPEKVFDFIDEQINDVPWEESKILQNWLKYKNAERKVGTNVSSSLFSRRRNSFSSKL